jgi:SWI/SNF-related matrix-associated actin-dependent regulator 1 of chromatin subfamily A
MSSITPLPRTDWFIWRAPPDSWRIEHADVPGLVWGNTRGWTVKLHRSHLPLTPIYYPTTNNLIPTNELLRPYQREGLQFLKSRRGSLLAFEMRLGKTITACCAHDPDDGPLVVVGPLASRDVWRQWIERIHGVPPILLLGRKDPEPMPGYPAYFVHYDILDAHVGLVPKLGTLVLDEIHLCQSGKTRRTQAATVLATRAARVIGLSGTPMWSRPISLHPVLHLISPGAWGARHAFGLRYAGAEPGAYGWHYDGISNSEELQARLGEVVYRRTWKDVVGDLPLTQRIVEPIEIAQKDVQQIEELAMDAALARGKSTVAGYTATLRRKLASLKVKAAVETATRAMQDGHKVVIWTWHNEIAEKISSAINQGAGLQVGHFATFRLNSHDSQTVRDVQVKQFREMPIASAMIAGIAVGGVAIDLSCSDYAIFAEVDWTPANVLQAEMRTFSPTRPHVVIYLEADVPLERKLFEALGVREDMNARVGLGESEIARMVLE